MSLPGAPNDQQGSLAGFMSPRKDSYIFIWLVVWNMAFIFPIILGIIIPTDFHIFQVDWNHQPVVLGKLSRPHIILWIIIIYPESFMGFRNLAITGCSQLHGNPAAWLSIVRGNTCRWLLLRVHRESHKVPGSVGPWPMAVVAMVFFGNTGECNPYLP